MKITKTKPELPTLIITTLAVVARFIAFIFANPAINQHDVLIEGGHFDYAMYIFNNWHLADNNYYEFAQPPLNATLQALFMKFISLFKNYGDDFVALYANCKFLSLIYSLIILYLFYKIIKEFDLSKTLSLLFYGIMALYPGLIIMTSQYSNDLLSYVFFYLSLYLCIRWAKNHKFSTIILLALSISFGMLTKISVGLISFIVGPMMLAVLIHSIIINKLQDKKTKTSTTIMPLTIILQIIVFLVIVTPIGLSYSIRNYIVFGQGFGEISDVVKGGFFDTTLKSYTPTERYWSFAFSKLYDGKYDIFHDWAEYNIWVDLVKTSAFDEFQFRDFVFYPVLVFIWFYNILFYFISFIAVIYNIINLVIAAIKNKLEDIPKNIFNLSLMSIMLYILAIIAFLFFNIKYPYSCNSNYRYVAFIIFALAGNLIVMLNDTSKLSTRFKNISNALFNEEENIKPSKKKVSKTKLNKTKQTKTKTLSNTKSKGIKNAEKH